MKNMPLVYPTKPRKVRPDVVFLDAGYFAGIKGRGGKWVVRPGSWHTGVDWNGPGGGDTDLGQPVYAIASGVVVFAGLLPGRSWGNGVVIRHAQGYFTRSMHLQEVRVRVGQTVQMGQQIGTVGKGFNNLYAAHLHFDVMVKQPPNKGGVVDWGYWPFGNLKAAKEYFTDPVAFFAANKTKEPA